MKLNRKLAIILALCAAAVLVFWIGQRGGIQQPAQSRCSPNMPADPQKADRAARGNENGLPKLCDDKPTHTLPSGRPAIAVPAGAEKVGADGGR